MTLKERILAEARGLTTFGRSVVTAGCVLLVAGLGFGSYPYLLAALLLLGVAYRARGLQAPRLDASRATSADDVRAGDPVEVILEARNDGAPTMLTLHDKAPDAFLLDRPADGGDANFGAAWLGTGEATELRYRLRAPRRGAHPLGPLRATAYDPLFLQSALVSEHPETTMLAVHPRTPQSPRIRTSTAWGRAQLPGGDRANRGILTNDFRELRPYERGDPLRQVNWKATARMSRDSLNLIVNDYEVEGKKAVWVFVDASPYTVGGTTLENVFDELAAGALAVAGHYLDLGHRVGFTLYGSGPSRVAYPDSGDLQERRISAILGSVNPGDPGDGIAQAVEASKGFLVREKPLLFVFTLAGRDPALASSLVTARALATAGRRPGTVVCVTPADDDADEALAARMVALREKAALKGLERRGITVLRFHPTRAPLMALLARGVAR